MVVIAVCSGLYLEWRNSVRQILKQSADVRTPYYRALEVCNSHSDIVIHPVVREPHLLDEFVDLGNCMRQIINSLHSALMSVI